VDHISKGKYIQYESDSGDSILYRRKTIRFDLFDIYSVSDLFINTKVQLSLSTTFIIPDLLRDSSRVYTLYSTKRPSAHPEKNLSKHSFDSTLKEWGLFYLCYED
jgi:hypothetical protein